MNKIVKHLGVFSRQSSESDWVSTSIAWVVKDTLVLLGQQLINNGITIDSNFQKEPLKIHGNNNMLESVFQNLMINSKDSFALVPGKTNKHIKISATKVPEGIKVVYEDNAAGITPEVQARMFEPFFTTKDPGKGTGLGMSVLLGIVKDHGGTITCNSEVGFGTVFTMIFPELSQEEVEAIPKKVNVCKAMSTLDSRTKVLVVDDDPDILELMETALGTCCSVTSHVDPIQAVEDIKEKAFDVIMTDLRMPNMDGVYITTVAQRFQPQTPVLVITGNDKADQDLQQCLDLGATGILHKPFSNIVNLFDYVQNVLKGKSS